MTRGLAWGALATLLVLTAPGCPGDGSSLVGPVMGGIEPTLPSIQQHVFGAICVNCHVPGGPGQFMLLDSEDASYQNLVNVLSLEAPPLHRVEPGDPDASYLVHKIEGRDSIVSDRMPPPPEPMLSPEEIAAIRQWIQNGAPR